MYGDIWIVKGELLPYRIHAEEDGYLMHFCYKGYSSFSLKYMHFLEMATELR